MTATATTMPRMGRRRKEVDQSTYSGRVAARLRMLREKSGKTVPEMAKAVGVPAMTCERCKILPGQAVHHLTYERKYREQIEDLAYLRSRTIANT